MNPGPLCFACEMEGTTAPKPVRPRRTRLPHGDIIALYREVGSTTQVAERLDLPRSSVWSAIEKAKSEGLLPES